MENAMTEHDKASAISHLQQIQRAFNALADKAKYAEETLTNNDDVKDGQHLVNDILWAIPNLQLPTLLKHLGN
jgi:hypothetical protein